MKIAIGSDHGGFKLKALVSDHLRKRGYEVLDLGPASEESCDYPIYGEKVGLAVQAGEVDLGIAICGTGLGISMAVNKVRGIRGALCTNEFMAAMARGHNDANVLVMGARVLGDGLALRIVDVFLDSEFEGDRHQRRIDLLTAIEKNQVNQ